MSRTCYSLIPNIKRKYTVGKWEQLFYSRRIELITQKSSKVTKVKIVVIFWKKEKTKRIHKRVYNHLMGWEIAKETKIVDYEKEIKKSRKLSTNIP